MNLCPMQLIGRMLMLLYFPVFGVTQGFLPIAGLIYGAKKIPEGYGEIDQYRYPLCRWLLAFISIF